MSSTTHPPAVPRRLARDPFIGAMAARLVTVPLETLAYPDGTPRPGFAAQARRDYRRASRPAPGSTQDLTATPEVIASAVLTCRARLRAATAGLPDMPGIHPESAAVTQLIAHLLRPRRGQAPTAGTAALPAARAGSRVPGTPVPPRTGGGPASAGMIAGVPYLIEVRNGRIVVTLGCYDPGEDDAGLLRPSPRTGLALAGIRTVDEAGRTHLRGVAELRPQLARVPALLCDACYEAGTSLTAGCQDSCTRDLGHPGLCDQPGGQDWCQWCGARARLHETTRSSLFRYHLPAAAENSDGTWQLAFRYEQAGPFGGPADAWAWWHQNGARA